MLKQIKSNVHNIIPQTKTALVPCIDCGRKRLVRLEGGKPRSLRCYSCAAKQRVGPKHPRWKGGRFTDKKGYVHIWLPRDDFFHPMVKRSGLIKEHRLIMARHLGRCLLPWEVVHHKNGIKDDNRFENLELLPHKRFHLVDVVAKKYITTLEKRIKNLGIENAKLCRLLAEAKYGSISL